MQEKRKKAAERLARAMRRHIDTDKVFDGEALRRQVVQNVRKAFPGLDDELDQIGPLMFVQGFTGNPLSNTLHRLIRDYCRDIAQQIMDTPLDKASVHLRATLASLQREALGKDSHAPDRAEPRLSDDFEDRMFIVVDDDGEPVSRYYMTLKGARELREDAGEEYEGYRIVEIMFRALPRTDGEPDIIADDPWNPTTT